MRLQNIRAVEFPSSIFNPYKIFATRKYHCAHHHFLCAFSLCGGDIFLARTMVSPIGDTIFFFVDG